MNNIMDTVASKRRVKFDEIPERFFRTLDLFMDKVDFVNRAFCRKLDPRATTYDELIQNRINFDGFIWEDDNQGKTCKAIFVLHTPNGSLFMLHEIELKYINKYEEEKIAQEPSFCFKFMGKVISIFPISQLSTDDDFYLSLVQEMLKTIEDRAKDRAIFMDEYYYAVRHGMGY